MSPAQTSPDAAEASKDAGAARARPSNILASQGPVVPPTKLLTAKEQQAAEEAKDKLERMVKVRNN